MKPTFTYHFRDEPQFRTAADRAWTANYLHACRRNGRYTVRRIASGYYLITLEYPADSPTAVLQQFSVSIPSNAANPDPVGFQFCDAVLRAAAAADEFMLPQTVYRDAESGGWWHTHALADRLQRAPDVAVTMIPAGYFT
jgi:hypothetical protein